MEHSRGDTFEEYVAFCTSQNILEGSTTERIMVPLALLGLASELESWTCTVLNAKGCLPVWDPFTLFYLAFPLTPRRMIA